ncbi:MAG: hypothetical protein ACE5OZ_19235 [Candidatus Heimdallarchaeota archaeon]
MSNEAPLISLEKDLELPKQVQDTPNNTVHLVIRESEIYNDLWPVLQPIFSNNQQLEQVNISIAKNKAVLKIRLRRMASQIQYRESIENQLQLLR